MRKPSYSLMCRALLAAVLMGTVGCVGQRAELRSESWLEFSPPPLVSLPEGAPADSDGAASGGPISLGRELAFRAANLVGIKSLKEVSRAVPDDCSGFVRFVYESEGIELLPQDGRPKENGVTAIYRLARSLGAVHEQDPHPGDLIFFKETYDRYHDGRRHNGLTHIGIVEWVEDDGTVTFVHRGVSGIHRSRMNLRQPRAQRDDRGEVLNDVLRRRTPRLRAFLTGELFSGFASPDPLVLVR